MSGMKINFAEVQGGFEPLPADVYDCIIERVEVRESNSSEHNYLNIELNVQDEDYEDRKVWLGSSLSPNARGFLKQMLVNLEVIEGDDEIELEWEDDVDITPREGPVLTSPDLTGIACQVRTVNTMWDGRERQDQWRSEVIGTDGGDTPKPKSSNGSGSKAAAKKAPAKKAASRGRKLR